jgi:hypothetical protein
MTWLLDTEAEADWIKAVTLAKHGSLDTIQGLRDPARRAMRHLPGKHNQKTHGKNFGDTVHPVTGRRPTHGYQVGQPTGSMIIPREQWETDHGQRATDAFLMRNRAIFDTNPDAFMGVWLDKAKGEIDLDVSHNILDLDTAMEQARQWDQQAIWDNVNGRVISVGGTGAREYAESRHQAPEGLLRLAGGEAPGVDPAASSRGAGRGLRLDDPEALRALEEFHARHLPGKHNQKTHGKGGGGSVSAAGARRDAERAGQRPMRPITSSVQLGARQKASLDEAWQPYTRKRKDGTAIVVDIDRAELKRHVEEEIKRATPAQREAGMRWYQEAHGEAMRLSREYDVEPEVAAKVIASLSPKTSWSANLTKADKALRLYKEGQARGAFDGMDDISVAKALHLGFANGPNADAVQAVRVMRGESGLPTGLKRQSFVNNILHPENGFDVTVDGWVAGALQRSSHGLGERDALDWVGRGTNQAKTSGLVVESKGYIAVADVVREVAAEQGMLPQQAQAVYWVVSGGGTPGNSMWES